MRRSAAKTSSYDGRAPEVRQVGVAELVERQAEALAGEPVHGALVETRGVVEEGVGLGPQGEVVDPLDLLEEVPVVGPSEPASELVAPRPEPVVERVEELAGDGHARRLDALAPVAVGLVRLDDGGDAEPYLLAVHRDGGLGLGVGDLVAEVTCLGPHVAVDGEGEQVGEASLLVALSIGVEAVELGDGLCGEERRVTLVDDGGVADGLLSRVVVVELLLELSDEPLGVAADTPQGRWASTSAPWSRGLGPPVAALPGL